VFAIAEYKELERALLARMFRSGIIDAPTFLRRVEALGYSPEDAKLMMYLEVGVAVRSVVRSETFFSGEISAVHFESREAVSEAIPVFPYKYFILTLSAEFHYLTFRYAGFRWLTADGSVISEDIVTIPAVTALDSRRQGLLELTKAPPAGCEQFVIVVRAKAYPDMTDTVKYALKTLEGVKY